MNRGMLPTSDGDTALQPNERETVAGFSVQTLSYPDLYELPMLGSGNANRLERAVALEIDPCNRVKRCRTSEGYVHEAMQEGEWVEQGRYLSLDELLSSEVYMILRLKEGGTSCEVEERD